MKTRLTLRRIFLIQFIIAALFGIYYWYFQRPANKAAAAVSSLRDLGANVFHINSKYYITFDGGNLRGDDWRMLGKALRDLPIVSLSLSGTNVRDDDLQYVNENSVVWLECHDTALTDACVAHLTRAPSLKWIGMEGTSLTSAGVARLREARPSISIVAADGTSLVIE